MFRESAKRLKALKGESIYPRSKPQALPRKRRSKAAPGLGQAARTPQPRTHPQIVLSSAAASRLQPRSLATAASSRPESATPPSPGSADAGSSFSDKSPCPRSRPRHSSPKAPTWKTRVFRSGSSYSGKSQPPLLGIVSCLPPTPLSGHNQSFYLIESRFLQLKTEITTLSSAPNP